MPSWYEVNPASFAFSPGSFPFLYSSIRANSSVDDAFQTAVATCYYWDLLSGTDPSGSFSPKGLINRAQAAVIYVRLKNFPSRFLR